MQELNTDQIEETKLQNFVPILRLTHLKVTKMLKRLKVIRIKDLEIENGETDRHMGEDPLASSFDNFIDDNNDYDVVIYEEKL